MALVPLPLATVGGAGKQTSERVERAGGLNEVKTWRELESLTAYIILLCLPGHVGNMTGTCSGVCVCGAAVHVVSILYNLRVRPQTPGTQGMPGLPGLDFELAG